MKFATKSRDSRFLLISWFLAWAILIWLNACSAHTPVSGPLPEVKIEDELPAYDAELKNYSYPRPVQFFAFRDQNQALSMAYEIAEPEAGSANGRTVVLLHGKNFSAAYWEPTIRFLQSKGYRVIAPDQIGFGKSTKPHFYQYSFHALARNTSRLLDSLGVKNISLIGHSMGGMLATRFALQYPTRVERMILVNPLGMEDYQAKAPYRTVEEAYQQELKATPETVRNYMRDVYFDGVWKPEYEKLVDVAIGWQRHADYPLVAWNSALTSDMIFTQPVVREFPNLKMPVLLLIGLKDKTAIGKAWASKDAQKDMGNIPLLARAAAKAIPRVKLVTFPKYGHVPQVEDFKAYSAEVEKFFR